MEVLADFKERREPHVERYFLTLLVVQEICNKSEAGNKYTTYGLNDKRTTMQFEFRLVVNLYRALHFAYGQLLMSYIIT